MPLRRAACRVVVLALALGVGGCAELQPLVEELTRAGAARAGGGLDATTVARGLREALSVGTDRTVGRTATLDGFLGNALLRIALPESLERAARTLRDIGLGSQVDAVEVAMNRAAEGAAGEAREVFGDAIRAMTIEDALGILDGGETAATDYFRERTLTSLSTRFRPIVATKMREVGVYDVYDGFRVASAAVPGLSGAAPDLEAHVTERTTAGLFAVLAEEEKRIRADPAARTTDLLRRVFGR